MASGIDGPGIGESPQHLRNPPAPTEKGFPEPVRFQVSFGDGMSYTPAAVGNSFQDIPAVTISEPMDSHLSFANLMSTQNADVEAPMATRRASTIPAPVTQGKAFPKKPSVNLADELDKVFEDGTGHSSPYTEPLKLELDFGNPNALSEVSTYNEQRYNDADYSSHRRSQRHHSKPLAAHLSSHELKSLKSRASAGTTTEKEKKKNRRRHRSSSSSSSHGSVSKSGDLVPTQRKIKRKEKKKKTGFRKSLTGPVRQRTLSIPEEEEGDEDEDESEEDDEEEDPLEEGPGEDDEERPDDDDYDKDGSHSPRRGSEDRDSDRSDGDRQPSDDEDSKDSVDGPTEQTAFLKAENEVALKDTSPQRLQVPSILSSKTSPLGQRKAKTASFNIGGEESGSQKAESEDDVKKQKKKKKHHHHHYRSSISQRRASGIQLRELDEMKQKERRKKHLSGDGNMEEQSHRYEEHAGIRKHLLHRPVKKRRTKVEAQIKTDKKPHEVFVELDELVSGEWKETARWIKFEEDVEESQQYGKPRVASLSFHSLLELRRSIEKGAVILDLANDNLTDIANTVVEQMVKSDQIREEDRGSVLRVLLSKHRHLPGEKGLSYTLSQASFGSFFSPSSAGLSKIDDEESSVSYSASQGENKFPLLEGESGAASDVERGRSGSMSRTGASASKDQPKIMKKIPEDAEATAVLVGSLEYLEQPTMAFVRLASGVDLENVVALPIPVRFIFVLLGPSKEDFDYHEIGRSISTLMADEEFHVIAYQADTRGDLLRAINEFLDDSIVLPPGQLENPELLKNIARYQKNLAQRNKKKQLKAIEKKKEPEKRDEDPLRRTRRCFGGLVKDIKRRYPLYWSDIKDAFNTQCLAAFIFIYFAALSPAITFGGLLGEKTGGLMGVSEMVIGCCFCGCMMALFSGQPMLIVGATGPLLVFEEAVYGFCLDNGLPFLATRFWVGMWICMIAIITVAFEGSFLIRFVSRFTQEIFAVLISLIFIYETFNKLFKIYGQHPLVEFYCEENFTDANNYTNATYNTTGPTPTDSSPADQGVVNQPNTALLSTILMFGTYLIAMQLRKFRNSKFLRSSVRRTIGDFGVPIAIFIMVLVDYLIPDTYTQKLSIPDGVSPTDPTQRGWLINPLGEGDTIMPIWMIFAAVLPAFLVFILIFMESHITELIVSKKERCLKKGTGFHLNILVLGIVNAVVSVFGLPWVCAAAVRSITHTNSLTVMSQTQAPGERPKIEATLEQRVTCFAVNAVLGLSILMGPVLRNIPIAVLFGIFLYMGVTSLTGVQFVDRMVLLFMPSKNYPDYSYVKIVRPLRIHIFTIIEIVCLAILWVVKSTPASIAFPFFLLLTVPLRRFLLPKIFTQRELTELDNDGSSSGDQDDIEEDHIVPD